MLEILEIQIGPWIKKFYLRMLQDLEIKFVFLLGMIHPPSTKNGTINIEQIRSNHSSGPTLTDLKVSP